MSNETELDICNSALSKLGVVRIAALTDKSKQARLCNQQYSKNRDKLLRMHPWNFATRRVILNPLVSVPPFGFLHEFQIPADNLKIYKVNNSASTDSGVRPTTMPYKVEGDKILSNDTSINLFYIQKFTNVSLMDTTFTELLAVLLAADISYALIQSGTLTKELWQQYREEIREIRSFDGQEGTPDSLEPDAFTIVRVSKGFDPTKLG